MNVYEKLMNIQHDLKAPKSNYNSFGKYNYRSCEDILEGVKPLLAREKAVLTVCDKIVAVEGRIYVEATATLIDVESGEKVSNVAYAREAEEKKGMDESQVTGTASSYARKYALNGLLCIDDTKDADTDANYMQTGRGAKSGPISKEEAETLWNLLGNDNNRSIIKKKFNVKSLGELTKEQYVAAVELFKKSKK